MSRTNTCLVAFVLLGVLALAGCWTMSARYAALDTSPDLALAARPGAPKPTGPVPVDRDKRVNLDEDPHLVGWWKLDDASGKTASDSSGHGRNGTLKGTVSFDNDSVPGRIGRALKLGTDDYIQITGYKGVTGTRPRTLAAWVKTTSGEGEIMSWGLEDYGSMWIFRIVRSGIHVEPGGGYLYTNSRVHDNEWHHVAAVVDEGDPPNLHDHASLYKDGVVQEIHDIGLLDLWPIDTGSDLDVRIGRRFEGLLDDVRIYDRALSADEIEALFESNNAGPR